MTLFLFENVLLHFIFLFFFYLDFFSYNQNKILFSQLQECKNWLNDVLAKDDEDLTEMIASKLGESERTYHPKFAVYVLLEKKISALFRQFFWFLEDFFVFYLSIFFLNYSSIIMFHVNYRKLHENKNKWYKINNFIICWTGWHKK